MILLGGKKRTPEEMAGYMIVCSVRNNPDVFSWYFDDEGSKATDEEMKAVKDAMDTMLIKLIKEIETADGEEFYDDMTGVIAQDTHERRIR